MQTGGRVLFAAASTDQAVLSRVDGTVARILLDGFFIAGEHRAEQGPVVQFTVVAARQQVTGVLRSGRLWQSGPQGTVPLRGFAGRLTGARAVRYLAPQQLTAVALQNGRIVFLNSRYEPAGQFNSGLQGLHHLWGASDGTRLVYASVNGGMGVYQTVQRQGVFSRSATEPLVSGVFSPDGRFFAGGSLFGTVYLFDLQELRLVQSAKPAAVPVRTLVWLPPAAKDGPPGLLAGSDSGSGGGFILLQLPELLQLPLAVPEKAGALWMERLSDGRMAAVDADGTFRIYRLQAAASSVSNSPVPAKKIK